jgi:spermidine/putrescine transport system substrate-binding protein
MVSIRASLPWLLAGTLLLCITAACGQPRELVMLTWSEYMDPELVAEFEQEFDAKVRFVYFESDSTRTDMLIENEGAGYDLILVNDYSLPIYARRGWIAELGHERIPNLRHIDSRWQQHVPESVKYGVPYFWGTVGIAYREDLVQEPITSWMDLYRPSQSLYGKVVMIRNMTDVLGHGLIALGYSANSNDPGELAEVERLLMEQRPAVSEYSYISLGEESSLVTGDTVVAMVYSGDALMVGEHHESIRYVVPEEGTSLWIDYLTIGNRSDHKQLAADFINFMNIPENAARQAEFVYYATPNKAAEAFLPEEYFRNPVIHPDPDTIEKSEFFAQYPPRALRERNRIFNQLLR